MSLFGIRSRLRKLLDPPWEPEPAEVLEAPSSPDVFTHADQPVVLWICDSGEGRLIVRCAQTELSWHEARGFASKRLGVEPAALQLNKVFESNVVEVRWAGDDYAHGGTPNRRRLQEKTTEGEWVDV